MFARVLNSSLIDLINFSKKFRNVITHQKNYKIVIENVFSQPDIFRVINIKCFS